MRIAIVGYGRMGRMVHRAVLDSDNEVVAVIDPFVVDSAVTGKSLCVDALNGADVAIDFSSPDSVVDNIIFYGRCGIPAVIGTTGWYDRLAEIEGILEGCDPRIIYSGNFSIGVAVFLKTVDRISKLMDGLADYDVAITETHHTGKADSPSGTALMIADAVMSGMKRKKRILTGNSEGKISPEALQVSSVRVGKVPGIHEVVFDGPADTIVLTHTARSREGFARGAVLAAEWIRDRHGIFKMDDFIDDLLG